MAHSQRFLGPLTIVALVVGAGAVASAGPTLKPIPGTMPTMTATMVAPPPPVAPVAWSAVGWAHSINMGQPIDCSRPADVNQVIVYQDPDYKGACAALTLGFYPRNGLLGVANDSITSMKVGRDVRLRAYKGDMYTGGYVIFAAGQLYPRMTSDWNDAISSARVEPASRSQDCNDLKEGEVGLYQNTNFSGDCVVLPEGAYGNAAMMGIANDSVSSIDSRSSKTVYGFFDGDFDKWGLKLPSHGKSAQLEVGGTVYLVLSTKGINDNMTSMFIE